jgi:uncharacterized delta-60 repeat protein
VVQPDGKIVAAGEHQVTAGTSDYEFVAVRYLPDGTVDPSFGNGGTATVDFGTQFDYAYGVGIQPTGRIVMAGENDAKVALVGLVGDSGPGCTLSGGSGNDTLTGTDRADVLCGTEGNDIFKGLGGADFLMGGPGTDTASFASSPAAVTVNLGTGSASGEGSDALVGVERATGSSKGDKLTGSSAANTLSGGGGNDKLVGKSGDDRLLGGPGDDTMNGGGGTDTCKQGAGHGVKTGCEH